jgi:hypothetical protein
MLSKDSFTDAEWSAATALPGMVMGAAVLSDGRKLVTSVREAFASKNAFTAAANKYPENPLIKAFIEQADSPKLTSADENAPKPRNVAEAVELLTAQVGQIIPVIKEKASAEEFAQIREVLLAAAQAAVEATGSGPLGLSGEKVGAEEQAFMDKLTAILS